MSTLTQSPAPSGNVFDLRYEFDEAELEAMRRFAAATNVLGSQPIDDPVAEAGWTAHYATRDFFLARLVRFFPFQSDLLRWVFDPTTVEQGEMAAMKVPSPEAPQAPTTPEDAAAVARHERARKGGEAVVAKYGAAHMGAISKGRKPMPRYTPTRS
ncbi:MAG: hypothetical protein IT295_10240 [Dehalococcoidia bacterium]|nr:hypothetical protein [Dehalococcoidia bacterium]